MGTTTSSQQRPAVERSVQIHYRARSPRTASTTTLHGVKTGNQMVKHPEKICAPERRYPRRIFLTLLATCRQLSLPAVTATTPSALVIPALLEGVITLERVRHGLLITTIAAERILTSEGIGGRRLGGLSTPTKRIGPCGFRVPRLSRLGFSRVCCLLVGICGCFFAITIPPNLWANTCMYDWMLLLRFTKTLHQARLGTKVEPIRVGIQVGKIDAIGR